jgi:parallel beta-helix repeat protein
MLTPPDGHPGKGPSGIFVNFGTGKGQAIRLERLYMTLWEGMGVHLKGVDDLSISDCRFECTSAFNSLYHNVYLRRVRDVDIANNVFCDSPVGNGLQVSFSKNVRIVGNRSEGNAGHGIRVAASENVTLSRNTVLHNRGGAGIWLNCEKGTCCSQINADNNLVRHNTNAGIAIQNTVHARFSENTALDNGTDFTFRNARDVTLRANQFRTRLETKKNSVTFDQHRHVVHPR